MEAYGEQEMPDTGASCNSMSGRGEEYDHSVRGCRHWCGIVICSDFVHRGANCVYYRTAHGLDDTTEGRDMDANGIQDRRKRRKVLWGLLAAWLLVGVVLWLAMAQRAIAGDEPVCLAEVRTLDFSVGRWRVEAVTCAEADARLAAQVSGWTEYHPPGQHDRAGVEAAVDEVRRTGYNPTNASAFAFDWTGGW